MSGLHVNAMGGKFQVQALCQEEHVCLGGTVDCNAEFRRKTKHGTDIDDRARARLYEPWGDCRRKPRQRRNIERYQAIDCARSLLREAARLGQSGVVDQNADVVVVAQTRFDGSQVSRTCQIGWQHMDDHAIVGTQTRRQGIKARLVTRDQHQVITTARKSLCICRANTA
jgi:hypothetical protein